MKTRHIRNGICRKTVVLMVALLLALGVQARIVHTPAAAFAQHYTEGTFPVTDANGGKWSALLLRSPGDATELFLTKPQTGSAAGVLGYSKNGDNNPAWICVNSNSRSVTEDILAARGTTIYPGELTFHPLAREASGECYAVLRFEVPRSGRYSLHALFRSLNPNFNTNSRKVDVAVLLDGSYLLHREIVRPGVTLVSLDPFEFESLYLAKGQRLDFAVGPGMTEDRHSFDATGLQLEIYEEEVDQDIASETAFDIAKSFWKTIAAPTVPFADVSGVGTWGVYYAQTPKFGTQTALNAWSSVEADHVWQAKTSNRYPLVGVVNPEGDLSYTQAMLGSASYNDVAPGEFYLQPNDAAYSAVRFAFTVPEAGSYLVTYTLRDISKASGWSETQGVTARILADGTLLADRFVSLEKDEPIVFGQERTLHLTAGSEIELLVDNNGYHANDGTAGTFKIRKLTGTTQSEGFRAGPALTACVNGAYEMPYSDPDGGSWSVGFSQTASSDFISAADTASSAKLKGWQNSGLAGSSAHPALPAILANVAGAAVAGDSDIWVAANQTLFPCEFLVHPSDYGICGVVKFVVPSDGLYSADVLARDIKAGTITSGHGVDCHVFVNGFFAQSARANCDSNYSFLWATLHPSELYVKKGDSIELRICVPEDRNNSRKTNGDATGVQETIWEKGQPEGVVVSYDLNAGGPALTATGRIGWKGHPWAKLKPSAGGLAATLPRDDSRKRRKTGFTVCRSGDTGALPSGGIISSGASDSYTFVFDQLQPGATYTLLFYGGATDASSTVLPVFTVGGQTVSPTLSWSRPYGKEVAIAVVAADANGRIEGTFASNGNGGTVFSAAQIRGEFEEASTGLFIVVK